MFLKVYKSRVQMERSMLRYHIDHSHTHYRFIMLLAMSMYSKVEVNR